MAVKTSLQRNRELMPTIRHECGHLVAARALRFKTGKIKLEERIAGAAIQLQTGFSNFQQLIDYLEKRIPVLYAGAIAESVQNEKIRPEIAKKLLDSPDADAANIFTRHLPEATASDDFAKIREDLRILVGVSFSESQTTEEFAKALNLAAERLSDLSAKIVQANVGLINELALYFLDQLEKAGYPKTFCLTKEKVDEFLKNKEIKMPQCARSKGSAPHDASTD